MKSAAALALAAAIADLAVAQNATTTTTTGTPTATEPCAVVSAAWASQIAATETPLVDATVAYECLNSVPIHKDAALKYIREMKPYLEWQSDTAWKKDPPADYFYPPHDIWAAIDEVEANLEADEYPNEYAWQADLYVKVFGPAHDGHFVVYPDALSVIEWQRPWALVSISEEGPAGAAPVIKVYEDVIASPETASVVKLINGEDAETFIENWIYIATSNQDADAAYNSMFFEKADVAELKNRGNFQTGGRIRYVYPGNATSLTFENGTIVELPNMARIKEQWAGVVDGATFFETFCSGATVTSQSTSETTTSVAAAAATTVEGYPAPIAISSDGVISGYFLSAPGFEDVAVLSMLSFSPSDPVEFQHVAQDFFAASVAAGKTKLVVDVSANGGGYIFSGYDIFRQLFPDIVQEGLGHWREHAGFLAIADVYSELAADFDPATATPDQIFAAENVYNWRYDLDAQNKHFDSFADKFAPRTTARGDNFTNLIQWDFNDPLSTRNATYGFGTDITGYGTRANFTRPFARPSDIVVVLDGYCASTCTIFTEFLQQQAGVATIALGGRAAHPGKIQGIGGVKGSQSYDYANVLDDAARALRHTADPAHVETLARYTGYVSARSSAAALNVKDQILPAHVADGTPAQFVAQLSDCRLWWTRDMVVDVASVWRAAADAAFRGAGCAFGGIDAEAEAAGKTEQHRRARPAPFNKPRFALPPRRPATGATKKTTAAARESALRRLYMKVVD